MQAAILMTCHSDLAVSKIDESVVKAKVTQFTFQMFIHFECFQVTVLTGRFYCIMNIIVTQSLPAGSYSMQFFLQKSLIMKRFRSKKWEAGEI